MLRREYITRKPTRTTQDAVVAENSTTTGIGYRIDAILPLLNHSSMAETQDHLCRLTPISSTGAGGLSPLRNEGQGERYPHGTGFNSN